MNKPLVSVILPTFNRGHIIERSINSILSQTYQNFELLVIDDGSTDNTKEVISNINDKRIKYYKLEVNKGASHARNIGIKLSKGDYIAFQDSDDEWLPEKLEHQVEALEKSGTNVGMVYTGWVIHKNNVKIVMPPNNIRRSGDVFEVLLSRNFIGTPMVLIKRECFEKVGLFDESLTALEDWELWIRLSKEYNIQFIDQELVNVYVTPRSITSNFDADLTSKLLIIKKHYNDLIEKKMLKNHISGIVKPIISKKYSILVFTKILFKALLMRIPVNILVMLIRDFSFLLKNRKGNSDLKDIYQSYYQVLNRWLKNRNCGKNVSDILLEKGLGTIAIYGMGELGYRLFEELRLSNIQIKYFIDKSVVAREYRISTGEIPYINIEEIPFQDKVDAIIVTPIYDFSSIKKELDEKLRKLDIGIKVLSLDEIIV